MCFACEEADMSYRWLLVEQIARATNAASPVTIRILAVVRRFPRRGEMPPGETTDDLHAMGLALSSAGGQPSNRGTDSAAGLRQPLCPAIVRKRMSELTSLTIAEARDRLR